MSDWLARDIKPTGITSVHETPIDTRLAKVVFLMGLWGANDIIRR